MTGCYHITGCYQITDNENYNMIGCYHITGCYQITENEIAIWLDVTTYLDVIK